MSSEGRGTGAGIAVVAILLLGMPPLLGAQAPARPAALNVDVRPDRDNATVVGHASSVRDLLSDIARRAGFELLNAEKIPNDPVDTNFVSVPLQVVVRNLLSDAGVNFLIAGQPDRLVPARVLVVGLRTEPAPAVVASAPMNSPALVGNPPVLGQPAGQPGGIAPGGRPTDDRTPPAGRADPSLPVDPDQTIGAAPLPLAGVDSRPAPFEVRPVRPEDVMMPVPQGTMMPPISGLAAAPAIAPRPALGAATPGQMVPAVNTTPDVTLPAGLNLGAAPSQSGSAVGPGASGVVPTTTGGTPDPATAQVLMPGFKGPQLMSGPPPGTPQQTGTPTPPKTTASPIIK